MPVVNPFKKITDALSGKTSEKELETEIITDEQKKRADEQKTPKRGDDDYDLLKALKKKHKTE